MEFITQLHAELGIMRWPFTVLSTVMIMLIFERIWNLSRHTRTGSRHFLHQFSTMKRQDEDQLHHIATEAQHKAFFVAEGIQLLLTHRNTNKALREDIAGIWLQKIRRQLLSGVKILSVIGMISPLLGLLGTVLGLMEMFQSLATHKGAIEPSQLADGLGFAMTTTAVGLMLALPALVGAHLFQLWAERILSRVEYTLNYCNLFLEGVQQTTVDASLLPITEKAHA